MLPLHLLLFKTLISYWLFFPFLSSCPQAVSFIPNWLEMPWELADSTSHPLYQSRANLWVLISFLKHLLIHKAGSSPRVLVALSWKPRASTDRYLGVSDEVERHLHVADQGPFEALRLLGGVFLLVRCSGFPGSSDGKASACNTGDPGSIPGLGRSPGEGNGNPLQHSCLENPMDGGA